MNKERAFKRCTMAVAFLELKAPDGAHKEYIRELQLLSLHNSMEAVRYLFMALCEMGGIEYRAEHTTRIFIDEVRDTWIGNNKYVHRLCNMAMNWEEDPCYDTILGVDIIGLDNAIRECCKGALRWVVRWCCVDVDIRALNLVACSLVE